MTTEAAVEYHPQFTFGDRLRRIRRDQGLVQAEFASVLGVGEKAYGAWESDINAPRFEIVAPLANRVGELYGSSVRDWLLGLNVPEPPDGPGITQAAKDTDAKIADLARKRSNRNESQSTHLYAAPPQIAA